MSDESNLKSISELTLEQKTIMVAQLYGWTGPFQKEWLKDRGKNGEDLWEFCGTNPEGERDILPNLDWFFAREIEPLPFFEKLLVREGLAKQ
jgi:hypothetical protein